jgi:hypothetical protein
MRLAPRAGSLGTTTAVVGDMNEAAAVHCAPRGLDCGVVTGGLRAAIGNACHRISQRRIAAELSAALGGVSQRA